MLSLQEISDRLEIQDLLSRYSYAIDERNWDGLDDVFTPDPDALWSSVLERKGGQYALVARMPPDPSLTDS